MAVDERLRLARKVRNYRLEASGHRSGCESESSSTSAVSLRNRSKSRLTSQALETHQRATCSAAMALSGNHHRLSGNHHRLHSDASVGSAVDPVVAVAISRINQLHAHHHTRLRADIQGLRQECAFHRAELCAAVQAHSAAISALRPQMRSNSGVCGFIASVVGCACGLAFKRAVSWNLPSLGRAHAMPMTGMVAQENRVNWQLLVQGKLKKKNRSRLRRDKQGADF